MTTYLTSKFDSFDDYIKKSYAKTSNLFDKMHCNVSAGENIKNLIFSYNYNGDQNTIMFNILSAPDKTTFYNLINHYNVSLLDNDYGVLLYSINRSFEKTCNVLLDFIDSDELKLPEEMFCYISGTVQTRADRSYRNKLIKKIYKKFFSGINGYDLFLACMWSNNIFFMKYIIEKNLYNPFSENNDECFKHLISGTSSDVIDYFLVDSTINLYDNELLNSHIKFYKDQYIFNKDSARHLLLLSKIFKSVNIDLSDGLLVKNIASLGLDYMIFLLNNKLDLSQCFVDECNSDNTFNMLQRSCDSDVLCRLLYTLINNKRKTNVCNEIGL